MSEFRLVSKFLILTFKNWVLWLIMLLSAVGIILTYFTNIDIPNWLLFSLPYLALLFTGYDIYKNSAPKITIDKPSETDFEIEFPSRLSRGLFNVKFSTYIKNFGLQSGTLESINVNFLGVNKIRDEFILKNMNITSDEVKLSNKKNSFYILDISRETQEEYGFKFPMVLTPDTMLPLYIQKPMNVSSNDDMLEWAKDFHFELEYKVTDSFGTEVKKIPFNLEINNLKELKDDSIKEEKEMEEIFSGD